MKGWLSGMIKEDCISLDSPTAWKQALEGIEYSFGHTWENCYAMYLTTGLRTFLYSFENEYGRIVCPISEREFEGYVDIVKPSGFSGFVGRGSVPGFAHRWKKFAKERGYICGYIGLNPIHDCSDHFGPQEIYPYINDQCNIYVLDLTPSYDELFANLSTNRKRQLRHWNRIQDDLIIERSILTDFFLDNYIRFYTEKDALATYYYNKSTVSFLLSLDNVIMVGARSGGKVVAVSIFTYTPYEGEYLFNVSLPEGGHYGVPLLWHGINELKSLHVPILNLGGGWAGMAEFKRRFGASTLPMKVLKQIYEPEVYRKLCRLAKVDPDDMTGYFPAYRYQ